MVAKKIRLVAKFISESLADTISICNNRAVRMCAAVRFLSDLQCLVGGTAIDLVVVNRTPDA
jgi:hypothetical protein